MAFESKHRCKSVLVLCGWLFGLALPALPQQSSLEELRAKLAQLNQQGKYVEAIPAAQQALQLAKATFGPESPEEATAMNDLGYFYLKVGRYAEAEVLLKQAIAIRKKAPGSNDPAVAVSLNNLAEAYKGQTRYLEAEALYLRSTTIFEQALGPDDPEVAENLYNLAHLYQDMGRESEAAETYNRSLAILEKKAQELYDQKKYTEAVPVAQEALTFARTAFGDEHPAVAQSLNSLGALFWAEGDYSQAEPLFKGAMAIYEKFYGPNSPYVAVILENLGDLYKAEGNYSQAEALLKRDLSIKDKAGTEDFHFAEALNSLADVYRAEADYSQAEPLLKRALSIEEKLGPGDLNVATVLDNLATVELDEGNYSQAETLLKRALAIQKKAVVLENPDVAWSQTILGEVYCNEGLFSQAEPLLIRALTTLEKTVGPMPTNVAWHQRAQTLGDLAVLYGDEANYSAAEPLLKRSLAILESVVGPDHPDVARSLNNLAGFFWREGRFREAEPFFKRNLEVREAEFEKNFAYMSEEDRLRLLAAVSYEFPAYFSFCYVYTARDPSLTAEMYNVLLWEKGMVATSMASLRANIQFTGTQQALTLFDQLAAKRTQLATLAYSQPSNVAAWNRMIQQLRQESNDLEKQLAQLAPDLVSQEKMTQKTWQDVRKALHPGEAAVEVVRFPFFDGEKWTGKNCYVALVVTPKTTTAPALVVLGDEAARESGLDEYHSVTRKQDAPTGPLPAFIPANTPGAFYRAFWKPLESALVDSNKVYFSPDGELDTVAMGVVPTGDGDQLLMERYDIRVVNSTRDLLLPREDYASKTAVLIGDPNFSLPESEWRAAAQKLDTLENKGSVTPTAATVQELGKSPTLPDLPSAERGVCDEGSPEVNGHCALGQLPGTKEELERISEVLSGQAWQVHQPFEFDEALEEVLDHLHHPRVLHISTHGVFEQDHVAKLSQSFQQTLEINVAPRLKDPMLRSALFFAGANRVWLGGAPLKGVDDGILTAYQAEELDLHGTELVVLSACETGNGDVQDGEGVFGLRRAFQEAGAQSILMSMWKVPDKQTQELMKLFYNYWLLGKDGKGMDKHDALLLAQEQLRKEFKEDTGANLPAYFWGAWVLVGR